MSDYNKLVASLKSKDILAQFPEVIPLNATSGESTSSSSSSSAEDKLFKGHDSEQIKLMDELCIVLDYDDKPVGAGTKKVCHIMDNIEKGLLHRAFSVFLFNEEGRLLLQQRADEKITFPGMWTNTCCSHPLCTPTELGNDFPSAIRGVKLAAQRKLDQELGIPIEDVPYDNFQYLTRIHYKSQSGDSTSEWGEHEIDYILILKADPRVSVNPNEVKDIKYVNAEELKEMFKDENLVFTPWFKLICESYLFKWWEDLNNLKQFENDKIDRML